MGDTVFETKKKVLKVPFELIWDPEEEKESAGGKVPEQLQSLQSELSEAIVKDEAENEEKHTYKKKRRGSKTKSIFSKFRKRSGSKINEKSQQQPYDETSEAENNKNSQTSTKLQEDNFVINENFNQMNRTYPEEAEFLEYVDKLMLGLKIEESIEVDEINEEQDVFSEEEETENVSLSFIRDELNSVKEQEDALDRVAEILEPELRATMDGSEDRKKTSDQLLKDWFSVVAKRHNLLERKFQLLRALENGDDFELELRTDDVKQQLHILMKIPENTKTPEQHRRQNNLWRELIELVNKRDEIVQVEEEHKKFQRSSSSCSENSPFGNSCSESSPVEETPPKRNSISLQSQKRRLSLF